MNILWIDLETRGPANLPDVGVFKYAETAEIILCSMAWNDQEVHVEEWGDDQGLFLLRQNIASADRVIAHHGEFDCTLLAAADIKVPAHSRYCTLAQARRHGLPGGLDKLCEVFHVSADKAKMKDGRALMFLFCKPNKDGKFNDKYSHPVQWEKFKEYAKLDVIAMRELHRLMPKWNDTVERPFEALHNTINARGFYADVDLAQKTVELLAEDAGASHRRVAKLTDGAVERGTQRDRLLKYLLAEHGVDLPDMTKSTLERRLKDTDLPDSVRELIALRLESAKTSAGKHTALLKRVNKDNRLRGWAIYCGATRTGRFSSAGYQAHNPPRPTIPPEEIDYGIRAIKARSCGLVGEYPATTYAANAVRGLVSAAPGHKLLVADLANIEGRMVAWLAGQQWKLDAFRAYDSGRGPDLYKLAYARAFGIDAEAVTPAQRQIGKVMELMFGYGGAVGACITGSITYGIDLEDMARHVWPVCPRDIQLEATKSWSWAQPRPVLDEKGRETWTEDRTFGLPHDTYVACHALSHLWRRENPAVAQLWGDCEDAATRAIRNPGRVFDAGRLEFDRVDNWLRMRLPSGRYLSYPSPKIDKKGDITFLGHSPYTRKWGRQKTWGGVLVENASQGEAATVLREGMQEAERVRMHVVLHMHDELVCEVPMSCKVQELEECMTKGWDWSQGLPLAAKGFETLRWRKAD